MSDIRPGQFFDRFIADTIDPDLSVDGYVKGWKFNDEDGQLAAMRDAYVEYAAERRPFGVLHRGALLTTHGALHKLQSQIREKSEILRGNCGPVDLDSCRCYQKFMLSYFDLYSRDLLQLAGPSRCKDFAERPEVQEMETHYPKLMNAVQRLVAALRERDDRWQVADNRIPAAVNAVASTAADVLTAAVQVESVARDWQPSPKPKDASKQDLNERTDAAEHDLRVALLRSVAAMRMNYAELVVRVIQDRNQSTATNFRADALDTWLSPESFFELYAASGRKEHRRLVKARELIAVVTGKLTATPRDRTYWTDTEFGVPALFKMRSALAKRVKPSCALDADNDRANDLCLAYWAVNRLLLFLYRRSESVGNAPQPPDTGRRVEKIKELRRLVDAEYERLVAWLKNPGSEEGYALAARLREHAGALRRLAKKAWDVTDRTFNHTVSRDYARKLRPYTAWQVDYASMMLVNANIVSDPAPPMSSTNSDGKAPGKKRPRDVQDELRRRLGWGSAVWEGVDKDTKPQ